ncbi:MAG: enoyl-CoA hydratase/isomerase family protein, partial [Candidatus Eremiobacteraeota bacterium]|nr:enoyl-CoA hydratase/isomerase family protein [Candidatus Eremiobacteraeota bacterium]
MPFELLSVRDDGPIRAVTLERPEVHNAMSEGLMDEVGAALAEAERLGLTAFVVTGSGERSFCSGGDLKEFDLLRTREATVAMSLRMQRLSRALRRSPLISIAALNGDAYGGGLEFALAFDLRVAAAHARFGFLQVTLGITPAWRGVSRLRELVGRSTALKLLLTGERFDAQAALAYGLVDRIAKGDVLEEALHLARTIAAHSGLAVRTLKAMVDAPPGDDDEALEREAGMFAEAWLSDAHWAAVAASAAARRKR